jgi:DNA-binding MarR family transcriptional regulator
MTSTEELVDALLASTQSLVAMAIRTVGEAPVSLTVVQHRVLLLIEEAGTLSVTDVAARLGVDQSNASRHCTRLAALGLLRRTRASHDRRAVDLSLTRSGRHQVLAVRRARRRWAEQVLVRLTDTEATAVARGFELFAAAARAETGEPSPAG